MLCSQTLLAQLSYVEQRTSSGVLQEVVSPDGRIRTFKGIPYAAPPVGALRWRALQPVGPWIGIRKATEYPPRCMQAAASSSIIFNDAGPSEDCLYLNLWMPAESQRSPLAVMVWINGTGFVAGSTSEPCQDGGNLSKKGVLVVTLNYRLGIFGFFSYPSLTKESSHNASGNYGLLDQLAALMWIHDNIAVFGGDPSNVTIAGDSSGSFSISALIASPLAQGLFHRALGESGAFFGPTFRLKPRSEAEKDGMEFAKSAFTADSIEELRVIPAAEILQAASKQTPARFTPNIDDYFLPQSVEAIFDAGKQAHVPLLAGWNTDEEKSARDLAEDRSITYSTWKWLDMHRRIVKVYRYSFDKTLPLQPGAKQGDHAELTASSGSEVEFVFQVVSSKKLPWRPGDRKLSDLMSSYWSNFAKTGNPNGEALPQWPAYTSQPIR